MTKHILIATPCSDMVHSHYTNSIVNNFSYLYSHADDIDATFTYQNFLGHCMHDIRNKIVMYAKKMEASHIMWVNSDMLFPADSFKTLINHNLDFVGVNYSTTRPPFDYTSGVWNENKKGLIPVPTTNANDGLEQVDVLGFGLCLTSMKCFNDDKKPWFNVEYDSEKNSFYDENYNFCLSFLDDENIKIFVDHSLSKKVKHIGSFPYHNMCPFQNED